MSIYEKLAKIQNELKAPKSEWNKFAKYHYRTAENILQAVKPIAKDNGCVVVINDNLEEKAGRLFICSIAELIDFNFVPKADGEPKLVSATGWAEIPNNKGMDEAQRCGTASSYARKYALGALFGITNEKDSDAVASEQGETDEKEQAMQKNQERLDAMENWRMTNNGIEIKGNTGFVPISTMSKELLQACLNLKRFSDVRQYIEAEIKKK